MHALAIDIDQYKAGRNLWRAAASVQRATYGDRPTVASNRRIGAINAQADALVDGIPNTAILAVSASYARY